MSRILLKTTIPPTPDDWHIGRFALLAGHLRGLGHDVTARDLDQQDGTDIDLRAAADGGFDQVWLLGVDGSGALGPPDIDLIDRFRSRGGGLMLSRDHQDLGACLASIPGVGLTQHFHTANPESDAGRQAADDTGTPTLGWPNYHSGSNGDVQEIKALDPLHPLVTRADGTPIRWFPAHPHEGTVSAPDALPGARVVACGPELADRATLQPRRRGRGAGQGPRRRRCQLPPFCRLQLGPVRGRAELRSEPWGDAIVRIPGARADAERYAGNIAAWLEGR